MTKVLVTMFWLTGLTTHLKDSNRRVWNTGGMVTSKVKSKYSQKYLLGTTLTNRAPYKMSLDCTHIPSEKPLPNHP